MKALKILYVAGMAIAGAQAQAAGLVVHTTEFGVAKFHRYDNQVHPYPATSAWVPYILPEGVNPSATQAPLVKNNADGSVTIFYSTLEDMLAAVVKLSNDRKEKVEVLNVHGHGLPGGMWFPATAADLKGYACADWVGAATGDDKANYDQYYSPVSASDIQGIRSIAEQPGMSLGCTTGADEWKAALAKNPQVLDVFSADAQVHFLSCVVGLGAAGDDFTKQVATALLAKARTGRVETSTDFGLGDWSMPEGMGFWDYQTDAQLNHDNGIYPVDRKDREIMQKGTIRIATFQGQGQGKTWVTNLIAQRDFMFVSFEPTIPGVVLSGAPVVSKSPLSSFAWGTVLPARVRVPGTAVYVDVK